VAVARGHPGGDEPVVGSLSRGWCGFLRARPLTPRKMRLGPADREQEGVRIPSSLVQSYPLGTRRANRPGMNPFAVRADLGAQLGQCRS
jgi:hypothetical protein